MLRPIKDTSKAVDLELRHHHRHLQHATSRARCCLHTVKQMQRGVSKQGGEGLRAGREAHARFHPAGKPDRQPSADAREVRTIIRLR